MSQADGGPLVDWALAERVAVGVAGGAQPGPFTSQRIEAACADAAPRVIEYSRLRPAGELPRGESVDRAEWAREAIGVLRETTADLERRGAAPFRAAGPAGSVARALVAGATGAEAGAVTGWAARKVLGQYLLSLVDPRSPPRLLLVAPNIASARAELGAGAETFLRWIALHETTHAVQFGSVSWLREHLAGLVSKLLAAAASRLDGGGPSSSLRDLARSPRRIAGSLLRGELARAVAGPEAAPLLDEVQAAMAVVEGHAEHVMDAIAAALDPDLDRLRERLERRRDARRGLDAVLARLLGLDLKLQQYRRGKRFCDAVVAEAGVGGLNRVWAEPAALPSLEEFDRPAAWLARVASPAPA